MNCIKKLLIQKKIKREVKTLRKIGALLLLALNFFARL